MPPRDPEPPTSAPSPDPLTRAGLVLGTPAYMAPEQARGDVDAVGAKSDVYALGAILYELASGRPPYATGESHDVLRNVVAGPPPPLAALRPQLPADFVALVERAMDRDPARRLASARLLGEEVEAFRRGLDLRVYEYSALEQVRRIVRRNRVASLALAAALLALVTGLVVSILFARSADEARELAVAEAARTRAAFQRAEGQRLAAVSSSHAEKDPSLALLLGIQAARRAPGLESSSALHAALDNLVERRELRGHEGYVFDVSFSADGSRVASLSEDGTARIWDARRGIELARIAVPRACSVTFSPDGEMVAIVDERGAVKLWSTRDGSERGTLAIPLANANVNARTIGNPGAGPSTHVGFAPDGGRIVACSTNGYGAWFEPSADDRATWIPKTIAFASTERPDPASFAFADDGSTFTASLTARLGAKPVVEHRTAPNGEIPLLGAFVGVLAVAMSADGSRCATAESDRVRVWDAKSGELVRELSGLQLDPNEPTEIVLSRRGDRLLQNRSTRAFLHGPWRAFDVDAGAIVAEGTGGCRAALDPEGRLIAAIDSEEANVVLLDARDGARVATARGHRYGVTRIAFAPDGRSIVTASRDRLVRVFACEPGWTKESWSGLLRREIVAFDGPTARAIVRTAPDRAQYVDARDGASLGREFVLASAAIVRRFDPRSGRLDCVEASTESATIATVVDLALGEIVASIPSSVSSVVSGSNGRAYYALRDCISERDSATHEELRRIAFVGRVLAIRPDASAILACGEASSNVAEVVECASGRTVARLEGHRGLVLDAEYSSDGARIVTTAADSSARLWDARTHALLFTLRWPAIEALQADFDASGERVLVRSGREVRVYSTDDGRELVVLAFPKSAAPSGFGAPIVARLAGFAPDDDSVALCEPDGRVRISPIDPLPLATAVAPRELEPNELTRFHIGTEDERRDYTNAFYERRPSASFQVGLARTALADGDLEEAVRCMDKAVAELPNFAPYHVLRGVILARRAFAVRPDDPERARRVDAVFDALAAARAAGAEAHDLRDEPALEPLAQDPRWEALLAPR